jgi:N-acetylmuramoyl-L-alanine amidase
MRLFWLIAFCVYSIATQAQDSVWIARTIGRMPYMKFGIGEDRLGGAKMNFLDSNIYLRVVDSIHSDYRVQLSNNHTAYISKDNVTLVRKEPGHRNAHNTNLTDSWKAFGDSAADYLWINLTRPVPFHSWHQIHPSRIVVDLYGLTSNINWINQLSTAKEIRNVWYEQPEDDLLRVFVELRHEQHWGHSLSYDSSGKFLILKVRRPPVPLDIHTMRIAIDAGHGGDNNGSRSISGRVIEKNLTLVFAKELERTLKTAGVKNVFMTRRKDTSLSMAERLDLLRGFNPDFLISLHLNAADADTVRGVSTYYRYIGFRPLSEAILHQLLTLSLKEFGNIGSFNFGLNGPTDYPNVLVELGFLTNSADEKKMISPKFQKLVAQKIYLGILDWIKRMKT